MFKKKLKFGYMRHKGTGIGGRSQIQRIPYFEKVGLTNENSEFAVEGKPKDVMNWLLKYKDTEISGPDEDGCDMYILVWTPKKSGEYYLEQFGSNFIKGGGLACRLINKIRCTMRITFIEKGGTHRAGTTVRVAENATLGDIHSLLFAGDDDDSDSYNDSYSSSSSSSSAGGRRRRRGGHSSSDRG